MKFFTRLIVLFYMILVMFICALILVYIFDGISLSYITLIFHGMKFDDTLRIGTICSVIVLLFINFIFYNIFSVNVRKEKIIAFDNPSGRVSVSLLAMEDLVKRRANQLSEVKDVKAAITASKKGLQVKIRIILRAEVNIPEVTSKVQDIVKKKIQDTIGLDEPVNVTIYIGKILSEKVKEKSKKQESIEEKEDANIPFRGYRA